MKKLLILLTAAFATITACAQQLEGQWNGKLDISGMQLSIVFNITKSDGEAMKCTLDSPDQNVKGIPAEISVTDNVKVSINVPAIMASYEGELKDGLLKGTFKQSGMSFPLDMKQGGLTYNRPQTPKPPYPYTTEEITFTNSDDNTQLSGTLTYPTGYAEMKKEDVPVMIMVTGSGLQNRDEEIFNHKPFLVIADYLARNGIASLRYDDRGAGKSTGNPALADSEDNMKDALAAIDYVRKTGKFGKTGVLGHSEGGMIAFMIASRGKADFIVSMAGTGVSGDAILLYQNRHALSQSGMPAKLTDDYIRSLEIIFKAVKDGKDIADSDSTAHAAVKEAGAELPQAAIENLSEVIKACNTPWMRFFIKHNPADDIKAVKCPVMAINGDKDTQVTATTNLGAIQKLLPANKDNMIKTYEGLNHLFQPCTTGNSTEYIQIEQTISDEVLKDIAAWINKVK